MSAESIAKPCAGDERRQRGCPRQPDSIARIPRSARLRRPALRRGAVAVEFALTSGILFLVLFTSIEFMRVNTIVNSTENVAYEAARAAIVPGATNAVAAQTAQNMLRAIGVKGAQLVVQPDPINEDTPEVTVTVRVPLNENSFVMPRFFADDTIVKTCTLSREVQATNSTSGS
jgi:Flp pilus assembly protein TadG